MDEEVSLVLTVYEGRGLTSQKGWNVQVVSRLEEVELSTSPVPLTTQPKFEEEISWNISLGILSRLRKLGVSLVVDCIAQQQESGEQCSLGHAVLSLTSLDPGIKSEPMWHSLVDGPHNRLRSHPSLLLNLNLHDEGAEVVDDFAVVKPKQKIVMERDGSVASSSKESDYLNAAQETDIFTTFRRAGDGSGRAATPWSLRSAEEKDEIQYMEESKINTNDIVTLDESQGSSEWKFNRNNLESRSGQFSVKSYDISNVQEHGNSLHGHSVPSSHLKSKSFPSQNHFDKRSLQQSTSKNSSVKENGHRVDLQLSSSKSNDLVALPSTSKGAPHAPEKLLAVPLLNAQGSYFQIGTAGLPDEQMFEYSVTIVFAKYLDQLVPPNMEIRDTDNIVFCYSLLTHFVCGEPIQDLANPDFQAENAMGRICSTVHNLSEYFMQHLDLPINLTVGDVCLASANVRLSQFAGSILTGGLPVKVEGSYPLVPNLFSPLGWKPRGEPVVGIIVNLASVEEELSVLPFPSMVRDILSSDRGFHPMLDVPSASSSDSQEDSEIEWVDQKDGLSSRNNRTVARLGHTGRHKKRHKTWAQKGRQLHMAALEVEKWKENEQESFWKQWSAREAELQQHLAQEWESHMNSMETQLQQRLEQCHTLHQRLTEGLRALETQERSVSLKEESIKTQKEDLKLRKSELKRLMKEVGKISNKERERVEKGEAVNLQQQLFHEKQQRRLLQREVRDLEAAKRTADSTVDALRLGSQIKDEDINVLKRDKERLQEELSACRQRKEYYKMQWVKAVGQLHQTRADVNNYRVDIEKLSPKQHRMQPQAKNSIQYKDERQSDRRQLRSLPQRAVTDEPGKKGSIMTPFTDSKKFVKDLIKERKGLKDMVAKRRRVEEGDESKNEVKVLSSTNDVRKMMHSLVDR
ncbi:centrosomal protein of 120 kDa-like [Eriocheir sinensis]|uniref:centrosomal protein of 120 kDa-like n=1 Tax=Eriocheir sinensis TaxID=95602 RepID=UPI0021C88B28|nr:centrosomal protein of 120 kDa-like [Eriocheir sinensis]